MLHFDGGQLNSGQWPVGGGQLAAAGNSTALDETTSALQFTAHCPLPTVHLAPPTAHHVLPIAEYVDQVFSEPGVLSTTEATELTNGDVQDTSLPPLLAVDQRELTADLFNGAPIEIRKVAGPLDEQTVKGPDEMD